MPSEASMQCARKSKTDANSCYCITEQCLFGVVVILKIIILVHHTFAPDGNIVYNDIGHAMHMLCCLLYHEDDD